MTRPGEEKFKVQCGPYAVDYIRQLRDSSTNPDGTPRSGKYKTAYDALRHTLDRVISEHALNPKFALGARKSGSLHGVFRQKSGRLRVFWIASKPKMTAIVLFIGYRKAGDKKDAYEQFKHRLSHGDFDHHFKALDLEPLRP